MGRAMGESTRYATLDGLRGIAAIAVVIYHLPIEPKLVPHGYLAVDFFLMLSGFVLALAYSDKLHSGMSFRSFFLKRAIRLYPIAIVGTAIGAAHLLLWHALGQENAPALSEIAKETALNILLIPYLAVEARDNFSERPALVAERRNSRKRALGLDADHQRPRKENERHSYIFGWCRSCWRFNLR
jgi:peptidoglycan/LPS O-acetylase OafA/YrhL